MTTRQLTRLTVKPGPAGAAELAAALPRLLAGSGPAVALTPEGPAAYVERVLAAVRPDDPQQPLERDDVAVVLATSGSTGEPRGVLLPAASLLAGATATSELIGRPARWVLALPVNHIAGLQVLVRAQHSGIPAVPLPSIGGAGPFRVDDLISTSHRARQLADMDGSALCTAIVPTQLERVLDIGSRGTDALAAYDLVLLGGAAAAPASIAAARAAGIRLVTTYGMTETAGGCVYDGEPLPGTRVHIAQPDGDGIGQIEISGSTVAVGYRLRPDLTAQAFGPGRHRTSDLGRITADGRLDVVGRRDDVVQVGGYNVSVAAVERLIGADPAVREAAVVSVPDELWGARLVAFVVPRTEVSGLDARTATIVGETLGSAAKPRRLAVVEQLPLLPNGKVDRDRLRQWASTPTE